MAQTRAASITNYFGAYYEWPLHSLAINAGDTVVWVNQQDNYYATNFIQSFGGEFKSPPMNKGDTFSFTFTNAGFYAYLTGLMRPDLASGVTTAAGTISVSGGTGSPPAVTINSPVDGSILGVVGTLVHASVPNPNNVDEVQFFVNANVIGSATNVPYEVEWRVPFQAAAYTIVAKAIDRQGGVTSSKPVNVTVVTDDLLWGTRVLPSGELLFYYIGSEYWDFITFSDTPLFTNVAGLSNIMLSGVFVDETVRGGGVTQRFYKIVYGLP